MSEHIVSSYEEELQLLDSHISKMGTLTERVFSRSTAALENRDPSLAASVIASDMEIDELERTVESQVFSMIARRQPMANDLRRILAALGIANELERIGDLSKNTAKRTLAVSSEPLPAPLMTGLHSMYEFAIQQLKDVLNAYALGSSERALTVWRSDERIDSMYNALFRELLTHMMEVPQGIGVSTHLLFGAKNIERVGDHATNIAETIYFLVSGKVITDNRPKGDQTSITLISGTNSAIEKSK